MLPTYYKKKYLVKLICNNSCNVVKNIYALPDANLPIIHAWDW